MPGAGRIWFPLTWAACCPSPFPGTLACCCCLAAALYPIGAFGTPLCLGGRACPAPCLLLPARRWNRWGGYCCCYHSTIPFYLLPIVLPFNFQISPFLGISFHHTFSAHSLGWRWWAFHLPAGGHARLQNRGYLIREAYPRCSAARPTTTRWAGGQGGENREWAGWGCFLPRGGCLPSQTVQFFYLHACLNHSPYTLMPMCRGLPACLLLLLPKMEHYPPTRGWGRGTWNLTCCCCLEHLPGMVD